MSQQYQVLARKYRPKNFHELVGQTHVSKALINGIEHNRLHHAYLFTGTRGVGKTTIARILAKCLNCETGVTSTPCGVCSHCVAIDAGRFIDLIEIDAASRTKVEDTRELIDNVPYAPTQGRYKVYLIDEVHMLSTHSFNALLKTLEEPPAHVKFLLATTDPQKLPITIISRCLQFVLRPLPQQAISEHLGFILNNEQVAYTRPALWQLANAAKGSVRDALSLTDQAIAFGQGQLTDETVNNMLGLIDSADLIRLLSDIYQDDKQAVAAHIEQMRLQMVDAGSMFDGLAELLHQLAMIQVLPDVSLNVNEQQDQYIRQLANEIDADVLQLYYQIIVQGREQIKLANTPLQALEMSLLRLLAFRPLAVDEVTIGSSSTASLPSLTVSSVPTSDVNESNDNQAEMTQKNRDVYQINDVSIHDSAEPNQQTINTQAYGINQAPINAQLSSNTQVSSNIQVSSNNHVSSNSQMPLEAQSLLDDKVENAVLPSESKLTDSFDMDTSKENVSNNNNNVSNNNNGNNNSNNGNVQTSILQHSTFQLDGIDNSEQNDDIESADNEDIDQAIKHEPSTNKDDDISYPNDTSYINDTNDIDDTSYINDTNDTNDINDTNDNSANNPSNAAYTEQHYQNSIQPIQQEDFSASDNDSLSSVNSDVISHSSSSYAPQSSSIDPNQDSASDAINNTDMVLETKALLTRVSDTGITNPIDTPYINTENEFSQDVINDANISSQIEISSHINELQRELDTVNDLKEPLPVAIDTEQVNTSDNLDNINLLDAANKPIEQSEPQLSLSDDPRSLLYCAPVELVGEWTPDKWDYWLQTARQSGLLGQDELALARQGVMSGDIMGQSEFKVAFDTKNMQNIFHHLSQHLTHQFGTQTQIVIDKTVADEGANMTPHVRQQARLIKAQKQAQKGLQQSPVMQQLQEESQAVITQVKLLDS